MTCIIAMRTKYKSIPIRKCYLISFYYPKKLLYQLHNIILQYIQYKNFYFSILFIKIIYLSNKIIYPKTISILSHLSPLSNYLLSSTKTKPPPPSKKAKKNHLQKSNTNQTQMPKTLTFSKFSWFLSSPELKQTSKNKNHLQKPNINQTHFQITLSTSPLAATTTNTPNPLPPST